MWLALGSFLLHVEATIAMPIQTFLPFMQMTAKHSHAEKLHLLVYVCSFPLQLALQLDSLQVEASLLLSLGLYLLLHYNGCMGSCFLLLLFLCQAPQPLGKVLVNVEQLPEEVGAFELILKHTIGKPACVNTMLTWHANQVLFGCLLK